MPTRRGLVGIFAHPTRSYRTRQSNVAKTQGGIFFYEKDRMEQSDGWFHHIGCGAEFLYR